MKSLKFNMVKTLYNKIIVNLEGIYLNSDSSYISLYDTVYNKSENKPFLNSFLNLSMGCHSLLNYKMETMSKELFNLKSLKGGNEE